MEWFENEDFWRDFYPYMFSAERFAAAVEEVNRITALPRSMVALYSIFAVDRQVVPATHVHPQ